VERQLLEERRAKIICLSAAMRQVAWRHYALREGQVQVVLNGVDLRRYSPEGKQAIRQAKREQLGLDDTDVAALIVSNNHRRKGLRQAIEAIGALAKADARAKLVVVGRDRTSRYERLAATLGVRDRVVFAGAADDPVACYAACDLFVLPTAFDPCSLVVLEALAMGLPVITTRQNGAGEVMEDGVHGFLVDDQADVPALREAWGNLLSDSLRQKMRQAAMSLRGELSTEKHLERVLAVYHAQKP
jgi:UDP-glucose:(heptosyl)LPS alpha-1,3-glucosyltransferase